MKKSLIFPLFLIIVIISGLYFLQKGTPYPSINSLVINTDETPTWKTFTNTEFNFSFQHPSDWIVVDEPYESEDVLLYLKTVPLERDPTHTDFIVSSKSISAYTKDITHDSRNPGVFLERYSRMDLNGLRGVFLKYRFSNGCWSADYLFERSALTYDISFLGCDSHSAGYDQLREGVANTFKLLPQE